MGGKLLDRRIGHGAIRGRVDHVTDTVDARILLITRIVLVHC